MVGCFKVIQFTILVFLFLPCIVQVLTKRAKHKEPSIEEYIQRFVKDVCECKSIPGLTLAVVKDDRVQMTKGFGYKNLETKEKADERTLFGIASLTKAITAATLAKILQERNITLATPLNEFMNITFPSEEMNSHTTLDDLLGHRAGLVRNDFLRLNPDFTRRTIYKYLEQFHIAQDFRTEFLYSDVLYGLASYVTEILTSTTWEDAVTTELLRPLGMDKTTFSTIDDVDKLDIAHPYMESEGKSFKRISHDFLKKWSNIGGSGAVISNALDMTRWLRFLLNEGELDGKQIMNSTAVKDLFKPRNHPGHRSTFIRPKFPITFSDDLYSLGWRTGYYRGLPIIMHSGSTWGYTSMLTLFPGQKIGIFTSMIGDDDEVINRSLIHSYIADLYLGEEPWLNQISACEFPWKSSQRDKSKTLTISYPLTLNILTKEEETLSPPPILTMRYDFPGIYTNKLWGDLRFEMTDSGLKMVYGYASFLLSPTSKPLVFKAVGMNDIWFMKLSSVEFGTKQNNKKIVVSVTVPPFETLMPPTFHRVTL